MKDLLKKLETQQKYTQQTIEISRSVADESKQLATMMQKTEKTEKKDQDMARMVGDFLSQFSDMQRELEDFSSELDNTMQANLVQPLDLSLKTDLKQATLETKRYDRVRIAFEKSDAKVAALMSQKSVQLGKLTEAEEARERFTAEHEQSLTLGNSNLLRLSTKIELEMRVRVVSFIEYLHCYLIDCRQSLVKLQSSVDRLRVHCET